MSKSKSRRPVSGKSSAIENGTGERTFSKSDSSTNAESAQIRRADGKIIGLVVNGIFKKTVRASKHFLRVPESIAFDLCTLADAKARGARVVEVCDAESGRMYRATIARIWQRGFHVERGHGAQIALILSEWNRDGETIADQLTLF